MKPIKLLVMASLLTFTVNCSCDGGSGNPDGGGGGKGGGTGTGGGKGGGTGTGGGMGTGGGSGGGSGVGGGTGVGGGSGGGTGTGGGSGADAGLDFVTYVINMVNTQTTGTAIPDTTEDKNFINVTTPDAGAFNALFP